MPVRAVVVPGTSLLVPGAAGAADPLEELRGAVAQALDELLVDAPAGPLVVLAPVPRGGDGRVGRLRPSLGGAGVSDRWVPDVAAWPAADAPAAHVPASVALLVLRRALAERGRDVEASQIVTVEVAGGEPPAVATLRGARGIVVAGGAAGGVPDLAPEVAAALDAVAGPGAWSRRTTQVAARGEHLPEGYAVTVWRDAELLPSPPG